MVTIFRHLLPAAILIGGTAQAQSFQQLASLDDAVAQTLGAGIGEPGGAARPIDRRLKLAPCPSDPEIGVPAMGAVNIKCAPLGWRISVPLVPAARAEAAKPIVRRGDEVELAVESASFTVSAMGIADQDGAAGDRIRIRLADKGGSVTGFVTDDGRVVLRRFK